MKENDTRAAEEFFPSGHQPPSGYQRPPQYERIVCDKDVAVRDARRRPSRGRRLSAGRAGPVSGAVCLRRPFQGVAGQTNCRETFRRSRRGRRCGSATRKRAIPSSSSRAAMCMWSARRAVSSNRATAARANGTATTSSNGSRNSRGATAISAWSALAPSPPSNSIAARQQPPHLKAIFPYDPRGAYGKFGGFREEYPGGVLHAFRYLMDHFSSVHTTRARAGRTAAGKGSELARGDGGSGYPHVSASAQCAAAEGPAHAALF